ncbi:MULTISPECIES: YhdT family protein [Sporosarcina]|uniref:YhdT family protein n=1 Tax=Sporosarcina contaminans TaxID=633403 RepID=A0ABW3TWY2_9BACL
MPKMPHNESAHNEPIDPRFKIAHREAWIGIILAIINFIWWFGFAYGLGSRPVEEYNYIFGLPDWFFYSCVVGFVLISALVIVITKFFLKEVSFEEEGEEAP